MSTHETRAATPEAWQDRLAADGRGDALRELLGYLAEKRAELRRALDAGASPEEFPVHEGLLAAVDAAENAALAFWDKHNKE
ncbi:MAG: hypothetical protein LBD42_05705 [Desulfovibrio sp.]|jgi:hypothetical protein|nr:hypothetical protein [Desulfovibrio sp.]